MHTPQIIYRWLEAAVKISEIGTVWAKLEDSSFQHGTFRIIVLQNDVFLQGFDGKVRPRALQLCQKNLHIDNKYHKRIQ